ncbi:secretory pathway protein Sec39-domain-containing protein [Phakopsora pachyrhizi]|uniref:Secretory pathway protein Sec39-domain-containing protein n=1 Tax=Phakopsora pachyrhizi TaxID=170000 RepID=A0AAV0AG92_PHAPC|nr:secretory pathway protein Sec39-domain-containing protein [Phakopsora pachyrhizi]
MDEGTLQLQQSISNRDWKQSLSISDSLSIKPSYVHKNIISDQLLSSRPLSIASLRVVSEDDPAWTIRSIIKSIESTILSEEEDGSAENLDSDFITQDFQSLFEILQRCIDKRTKELMIDGVDNLTLSNILNYSEAEKNNYLEEIEKLKVLIENDSEVEEACSAAWISSQLNSRWKLYCELYLSSKFRPYTRASHSEGFDDQNEGQIDNENDQIDELGWDESDLNLQLELDEELMDQNQISFPEFYRMEIQHLAQIFALTLQLDRLRHLISTERVELEPSEIVDLIPLHARPSDLSYGEDLIALLPRPKVYPFPTTSKFNILSFIFEEERFIDPEPKTSLDVQQLTDWYLRRVRAIDDYTGCVDAALEFVQHGAAAGVTGLELIAEDLSLLAKLLYEAPHSETFDCYSWSLRDWETKSTEEILSSYLGGSSPSSLITDIQRLALPYLSVVESRRARLSDPGAESTIPDALRNWALSQSKNLTLLFPLIKSSSPTLKNPQRIIKSNEELARVAIACLYSSPTVDDWDCMGHIYECMPAFPEAEPPPDGFDSAQFLCDQLSRPGLLSDDKSAHKLYDSLLEVNDGCLSVILDALDEHLISAEMLATWNVPIRLAELVTRFYGSKAQQEQLASRIARQEGTAEIEEEEEWESIMEAMVELSKPGRALNLLDGTQVIRLFFSGLLSSGKFNIAKSLFTSLDGSRSLDTDVQEQLVIAASREFYDNAESGNLSDRDMKMALECLSVVPQSIQIRRERDFIEATSRLSSFRLESQPGLLMSPIEIRLKPNKLDLIQQILQENENAYQHPDLIMELINKLGHGESSLAQTKALSMVVDSALTVADFSRASETCERMLSILVEARKKSRRVEPLEKVEQVSAIVWKTCERLGSCVGLDYQTGDTGKRSRFLGHALTICPAEEISGLLVRFRKVETEEKMIEERMILVEKSGGFTNVIGARKFIKNPIEIERSLTESPVSSAVNLGGELASLTIERAVSLFPFNSHMRGRRSGSITTSSTPPLPTLPVPLSQNEHYQQRTNSTEQTGVINEEEDGGTKSLRMEDGGSDRNKDFLKPLSNLAGADRLTTALSNKFTSGVGWLIGANEDDLQ